MQPNLTAAKIEKQGSQKLRDFTKTHISELGQKELIL